MTTRAIIAKTPIQYERRRYMPGETLAPPMDVAQRLIDTGAAEAAPAAKKAPAEKAAEAAPAGQHAPAMSWRSG